MSKNFYFAKWAFLTGLILAILSGFLVIPGLSLVLFVLGISVGFMNIHKKEMTSYLISIIALIVVSSSVLVMEEPYMSNLGMGLIKSILTNFISFVSAAGIIIAIRSILLLGREKQKEEEK